MRGNLLESPLLAMAIILLAAACPACAAPLTTIDLEGLPDLTPVTNQYPGVLFTHATVLTASLSLNEFDFPPLSGVNAAFDDSGAMTLAFAAPVTYFEAYLTYAAPVRLSFHDSPATLWGAVSSAFSTITGTAGDPGSAVNELLSYSNAAGIASVEILGLMDGGSFAVDNISYESTATVPEPAPALANAAALAALMLRRRFSRS